MVLGVEEYEFNVVELTYPTTGRGRGSREALLRCSNSIQNRYPKVLRVKDYEFMV